MRIKLCSTHASKGGGKGGGPLFLVGGGGGREKKRIKLTMSATKRTIVTTNRRIPTSMDGRELLPDPHARYLTELCEAGGSKARPNRK